MLYTREFIETLRVLWISKQQLGWAVLCFPAAALEFIPRKISWWHWNEAGRRQRDLSSTSAQPRGCSDLQHPCRALLSAHLRTFWRLCTCWVRFVMLEEFGGTHWAPGLSLGLFRARVTTPGHFWGLWMLEVKGLKCVGEFCPAPWGRFQPGSGGSSSHSDFRRRNRSEEQPLHISQLSAFPPGPNSCGCERWSFKRDLPKWRCRVELESNF